MSKKGRYCESIFSSKLLDLKTNRSQEGGWYEIGEVVWLKKEIFGCDLKGRNQTHLENNKGNKENK